MTIDDVLSSKKYPLTLRSLRKAGCFTQTDLKKIEIDAKRQVPLAKLYIHEVAHILNPDMSEKDVLEIERVVWKKATHKQIQKLYKKIFS